MLRTPKKRIKLKHIEFSFHLLKEGKYPTPNVTHSCFAFLSLFDFVPMQNLLSFQQMGKQNKYFLGELFNGALEEEET